MTAIVANTPIQDREHVEAPRADAGQRAPSKPAVYTGRVLSGLAVLFLAFDASLKVFGLIPADADPSNLDFPSHLLFEIGLIQVVCLVAYLIPRTSVLGAILWTGYLGGAIAVHVRVGNPLFSHTLFPIYVAAFLWAGLWLRDLRVRALLQRAR